MEKTDFKKVDRAFYSGKPGRWDVVDVPEMTFLAVRGEGAPESQAYAQAVGGLYPLAYAIKFALKAEGADFVVPPLEALWWSKDRTAFVEGRREEWCWQVMLRVPDLVDAAMLRAAQEKKGGADVSLLRWTEGRCLQTLHVGSYADEAPVLADLHERVMPERGLTFGGDHHEIYLSDPRRVTPERLRTILRQPVKPA